MLVSKINVEFDNYFRQRSKWRSVVQSVTLNGGVTTDKIWRSQTTV